MPGHGGVVRADGQAEPAIRPAADPAVVSPEYRAQAQAAAEKFEGYFIGMLLRQMRSTTRAIAGENSLYGRSSSQDMLDMADMLLGDALASRRAFGIADLLLRQLLPAAEPHAGLKDPARPVASDRQTGSPQASSIPSRS
nr:MAG: flagellar biosynthesis protein FlgJ [Pseudomonadota bacterium]